MKYICLTLMMFLCFGASCQEIIKVNNKTFKAVKKESTKDPVSYTKTDMTYIHTNGKEYTIYKKTFTRGNRKGQTGYFITMSNNKKTGKPNWKEIKITI